MDPIEIWSLAASIASLVLAVVAIWLSVVFYRLSSTLSESTKEASKGISASVERLEKLFDKLYADTFSMMRDTVSDMRRHIWPDESLDTDDRLAEEAEKRADKMVSVLRDQMTRELSQVIERQAITDANIASVRDDIRSVLDRALDASRHVELDARAETLRAKVLRALARSTRKSGFAVASDIVASLDVGSHKVVRELERMESDGMIVMDSQTVTPMTYIAFAGEPVPWAVEEVRSLRREVSEDLPEQPHSTKETSE